jgi:hypothetical protein
VLWKGKKVVKICLLLYDTRNVNMYSFVCYQGDLQLPSTEDMWKDIYQTRDKLSARFANSLRHTVMVDFIDYLDELANLIGCKPNLGEINSVPH